jgi:hypothetical protein
LDFEADLMSLEWSFRWIRWGYHLVGGIPTPLKNMKVSWDDYTIPKIWKNKIHVPNQQPGIH